MNTLNLSNILTNNSYTPNEKVIFMFDVLGLCEITSTKNAVKLRESAANSFRVKLSNFTIENDVPFIDADIILNKKLSRGEKALYGYLCAKTQISGNGVMVPHSEIIAEMGISKNTIKKYRSNLELEGVIYTIVSEKGYEYYTSCTNCNMENISLSRVNNEPIASEDINLELVPDKLLDNEFEYASYELLECENVAGNSIEDFFEEKIKEQVNYKELLRYKAEHKELLDSILINAEDMFYSSSLLLNNEVVGKELLRETINKLTYGHMVYIIEMFNKYSGDLAKNKELYIKTVIFNSVKEKKTIKRSVLTSMYKEKVKRQVGYDLFNENEKTQVNTILEAIIEMEFDKETKINKSVKGNNIIKSVLRKLTYGHIRMVLYRFINEASKQTIYNKLAYLKTMVYNAVIENRNAKLACA